MLSFLEVVALDLGVPNFIIILFGGDALGDTGVRNGVRKPGSSGGAFLLLLRPVGSERDMCIRAALLVRSDPPSAVAVSNAAAIQYPIPTKRQMTYYLLQC